MSVLWVMPSWSAPSELWMQRMIQAIAPEICAIAAREPEQPTWGGKIPAVRLGDSGFDALLQAARRPEVTRILVHYLTTALQYESVWQQVDKPLFVHCHGYDITWDRRRPEKTDQPHFDAEYPQRVLRLSKRAILIANSHASANRLRAIGVSDDRIVVKYLGVPVSKQMPERLNRPAAMEPLNMLYLGRLIDFKGPELTITAATTAFKQGLQGKLILAGDGPMMAECRHLRELSGCPDRIELLGAVDEATGRELRQRAHVFTAHNQLGLLTRQEEAFGVAYAEAMADGLPIVTGRSGSLPELVTDDVEGLLFKPDDIDAHAQALLRLWREPQTRIRMGKAAWEKARRCFSTEEERRRLLEILKLGS